MPNITTCPRCGSLYQESSEEMANSPSRICTRCAEFIAFARGRNPHQETYPLKQIGADGKRKARYCGRGDAEKVAA